MEYYQEITIQAISLSHMNYFDKLIFNQQENIVKIQTDCLYFDCAEMANAMHQLVQLSEKIGRELVH